MSEVKTMDEAIKKIRELEDRNRKLLVVVNKLRDAGYDVLNFMDNEIMMLDRLKLIYDSECFDALVDALDTVDEIKESEE